MPKTKCQNNPEFHVFVSDFNPIFLPSESRHRDKKSSFWNYQPRSTELRGKAAVFLCSLKKNPLEN